ncbi:MAG: MFS transporter [Trebonia sp.]|uniref:MFS transporter n=1 Tax=Trebonia sp. TaxID=2767075 RepID=UPI003C708E21
MVGPVLALVIIFVRRHLPESPRWQIMHGRQEAAEASIAEIERDVAETKGELPPVAESKELEIRPVERFGYLKLLELLFRHYPKRAVLVSALMITQSFLYNAIFFTSGLVLEFYFHVNPTDTGYYFFASAGASAGYLTASEVFPLEVRAQAIAVFFAIAQLFGAFGSHWHGHLIGDGSNRNTLFAGYIVGAGAMILGGVDREGIDPAAP